MVTICPLVWSRCTDREKIYLNKINCGFDQNIIKCSNLTSEQFKDENFDSFEFKEIRITNNDIPELRPNHFGSLRFERIIIRNNQRLTYISSSAFKTEFTNYLEIRENKNLDGNQFIKFAKLFNNLQEIHIINNNIEEIFYLN